MRSAQIQKEYIGCEEAAIDPLCPECLGQEVKEWLNERIPSLKKEFDWPKISTGLKCWRCGNDEGVCAEKYLSDAYGLFYSITPLLARDFIDTFNFQKK